MKADTREHIRPDAATKELIASEIVEANRGRIACPLHRGPFSRVARSDDAFMNFSMKAYRHLDVSDDVRLFMGRLWADVVRSGPASSVPQFLLTTVRDPHEVFQALEFAFRQIQSGADEVLPWLL